MNVHVITFFFKKNMCSKFITSRYKKELQKEMLRGAFANWGNALSKFVTYFVKTKQVFASMTRRTCWTSRQ